MFGKKLSDDTEEELKVLAVSPTFAMSLGAKELFHTNFLAFLLETDSQDLERIRCELLKVLGFDFKGNEGELSTCVVWREKNNLDLVIVPLKMLNGKLQLSKKKALVIEAKLKSTPTKNQLEKYSELLKKGISLPCPEEFGGGTKKLSLKNEGGEPTVLKLLTPLGTTVHDDWPGIRWKDVASAIEIGAEGAPDFLKGLLKDYAKSLQMIDSIVTKVIQRVKTAWEQGGSLKYIALYAELNDQKFRKLRIHDLTGKAGIDAALCYITEHLKEQLNFDDKIFYRSIDCYAFYSRSQPGFAFEVTVAGDLGYQLGVQVQGNKFRHFVSSKKENSELEEYTLRNLLEPWLVGEACGIDLLGCNRKELSGSHNKKNRLTNLLVFNPKRFLYSECSLSPEMTMQSLAKHIEKSIEKALTLTAPTGETRTELASVK